MTTANLGVAAASTDRPSPSDAAAALASRLSLVTKTLRYCRPADQVCTGSMDVEERNAKPWRGALYTVCTDVVDNTGKTQVQKVAVSSLGNDVQSKLTTTRREKSRCDASRGGTWGAWLGVDGWGNGARAAPEPLSRGCEELCGVRNMPWSAPPLPPLAPSHLSKKSVELWSDGWRRRGAPLAEFSPLCPKAGITEPGWSISATKRDRCLARLLPSSSRPRKKGKGRST